MISSVVILVLDRNPGSSFVMLEKGIEDALELSRMICSLI